MNNLFKNYFTVILGTGLCRGISFLTTLILARIMGAHSFGVFSLFFTIAMLTWQFPTIIDAIYVRYTKVEINGSQDIFMKTTFFMKVISALILLILSYPLGFFLATYIFNKPEMSYHLVAAIISGAFLSIFSTLTAIFQAEERFYLYSLVNLIFYVLVFFIIIAIVLFRVALTPLVATLVYSASSIMIGVMGTVYLYNKVKPLSAIQMPLLYNMFHFGKWLFGVSIIEIISQRLDILFLARLATYGQLGIYSVAVRIAMLATVLTSSATVIFMPRGCTSLKSKGQLKSYFKESFMLSLILSVCILAFIALSPLIIKMFFGPQYQHSLTATRILLLDCIFILFYTPFSFLYYANGNTKQIFSISLVKLAIMSISLAFLVPRLGLTGAALSAALSSFLTFLLIAVLSQKVIRSPVSSSLAKTMQREEVTAYAS